MMNLEVGKKYINRHGDVVELVLKNYGPKDTNGICNQNYSIWMESAGDLIAEYKEPETQPKTCAMGEDCDLTIAYMKGFSDGKDSVPQWQPIESAPRDGKGIWAFWENENGTFQGTLYWDAHYEDWYDGYHPMSLSIVSHWMPLPPAPKGKDDE